LQELIHTSLGVFPDEDQIDKSESKHLVAFHQEDHGDDDVAVDIKNRPPRDGRMPMRFMYQGTQIRCMPDLSGAVLTRLLTIENHREFCGQKGN
jgi:hypothetical protein